MSDDSPVWSGEPVLCRSDYYADTGRHREHGDRAVRCNLFAGHVVDHDELVDDVPGIVTWPLRPSRPAIAEERDRLSGEEVRRLRQELDEARAERDRARKDLELNKAGWQAEINRVLAAEAERDRMRPVVEAAEAWVNAPFASNDMPKLVGDLVDAVEAFRSATPDAEPAPGLPAVQIEPFHSGRSWSGNDLEAECPCPKEACGGLVDLSRAVPECTQHPITRGKTMRQGHPADKCPALPAPGVPVDTEAGTNQPSTEEQRHA